MLTPVRPAEVLAADVSPQRQRFPDWSLVAVIVVLAAVLRFATITSQSYWLDEATTVHELHLSLGALLHSIRVNETTPPLYFVVGWLWVKVFGTGELGLRTLSALAGIALIPVVFETGRELVSRRAGMVAALFAAISPFMIWYSQEARSYMLFTLFCACSTLFWARSLRDPSARNLSLWALASALAVLTHFFAGFLIAPEGLWLLWVHRREGSVRAVLLACAAVAAVQLAVLPLALSDTSHPLSWITQFPLSIRIKQTAVDLGLSSLYQSSLVSSGLLGAALLAAIVLAILMVGGSRARELRGVALAAGLGAFVILVPLLLALAGHDYFVPRNMIAAWVPLAIVLAAAATAPRARLAGAGLALLVIGGFVYANVRIDGDPQFQRPDWRGVAAALGPAHGPRAIVAYQGGFGLQPLAAFMPRIPWSWNWQPVASPPVSIGELDVIGTAYQSPPSNLPAGVRLVANRDVNGIRVERFVLSPPWQRSQAAIVGGAGSLITYPKPGAGIMIQR
ncbi:MAG: glycosyltransferase family 39 protein [Solirubrobacteraceae bacterium]